ncbi:MAG: tyrosine-protein phosphatase [Planctomycetes bacterium]|nr:tyrosine-protein phosphatase [Planctomycetota bacterium]
MMVTIVEVDRRFFFVFKWCFFILVCAAVMGLCGGCGPGGIPRERSLNLKNAPNARDTGGYPAMDGMIMGRKLVYRSGKLSEITETECDVIQRAGIKTIIDLRSDKERQSAPDAECLFDFAQYRSLPIVVKASSRTEAYKAFADDAEISASISAIFRILAERDNLPVIIHCSGGKDRAGGVSALVQLLLGVNRDDIMADYLLSRKAGKEVKAEWMQAALEQVEDEGGIEIFLSNRGIGREVQQAVRANLLE